MPPGRESSSPSKSATARWSLKENTTGGSGWEGRGVREVCGREGGREEG